MKLRLQIAVTGTLTPCRKRWTMEEWILFVETYSLFVFRNEVIDHDSKWYKGWLMLRRIVQHYVRPSAVGEDADGNALEGLVAKGTDDSAAVGGLLCKAFATFLEDNDFPAWMFTYNLHLLCCRWVHFDACSVACIVAPHGVVNTAPAELSGLLAR